MATVKHPRIPHVTADVPDEDVAQWVASGWVADEPPINFDDGGALEPGLTEVRNDTGKPEPLVRQKRRK